MGPLCQTRILKYMRKRSLTSLNRKVNILRYDPERDRMSQLADYNRRCKVLVARAILKQLLSTQSSDIVKKLDKININNDGNLATDNKCALALFSYYLDNVVLNLAILGTSELTEFSETAFDLPVLKIKDGEIEEMYQMTMNISSVVDEIQSMKFGATEEDLSSATLRRVMSPFGSRAHQMLLKSKMSTKLFEKFPHVCRKAPQVAFDFNVQLSGRNLSQAEKKVKENLGRIIFKREIARAEYSSKEVDSGVVEF
ncbi:coat protein [Lettuce chordovirus 1]|uniref:Coat protein n=1 Tax=Lettuce chordovirus 1 TaxID=2200955 RepID=A0A2S1ZRC9_9VIRU|nr:coat protein [Lettuce chordovirus 1]AWK28019.1 coat protein [Lettuce chordovirus 1]